MANDDLRKGVTSQRQGFVLGDFFLIAVQSIFIKYKRVENNGYRINRVKQTEYTQIVYKRVEKGLCIVSVIRGQVWLNERYVFSTIETSLNNRGVSLVFGLF